MKRKLRLAFSVTAIGLLTRWLHAGSRPKTNRRAIGRRGLGALAGSQIGMAAENLPPSQLERRGCGTRQRSGPLFDRADRLEMSAAAKAAHTLRSALQFAGKIRRAAIMEAQRRAAKAGTAAPARFAGSSATA